MMGKWSRCAPVVLGLLTTVACGGAGESVDLGTTTSDETTTGTAPTTAVPEDTTTSGAVGTSTGTTSAAAETSTGAMGETFGPVPEMCGGDRPGPMEIGHGYAEYLPLDSGPAELIHGPQGGIHITLGLRCAGLEVSEFADVTLHGEIDGEVVADHVQGAILNCEEDLGEAGMAEAIWLSMIFDVGPEAVHEQVVDMELTLTDSLGHTVSATASTMVIDLLQVEGTGTGTESGSDTGGESSGSGTTG